MTPQEEIGTAKDDAARLEHLYRQAVTAKTEVIFKDTITSLAKQHPTHMLLSAWVHRLDISLATNNAENEASKQKETKHWGFAILGSIILGLMYMLLAWGKPPVPIPGESHPAFWIGWSPITALSILFYLAILDHHSRRRGYGLAAFAVALIGGCVAPIVWNQNTDVAFLTTIHLPFLIWSIVGISVAVGHEDPASQFHAFTVKSVETLLTIGIFLGAGGLLTGLTVGIFAAMDIEFSEDTLRTVAALGMGTVPLLALASVCDPTRAPIAQNWTTGLARILHILTRLMLPLTLLVLFVYVCWFIPAYFWTPFQKREVLIVYNATLVAIIVLLASVLPGRIEQSLATQNRLLYKAIFALSILALLLNAYALIAIISRTLELGLTANRHAVLGWNVVTFFMFIAITFKLWQSGSTNWQSPFCTTLSKVMGLAVIWTAWVLFGLPFLF